MAGGRWKAGKRDEDYVYLPLLDARKAINMKVNLFASVVEIGVPRRSKGTDYFINLRIADQSYISPGVSVNFFSEDAEKLPQVRASGDLICLHHVVMQVHNGEVYCLFRKKYSSFALFGGKENAREPYQASKNFFGKDNDEDLLKQLRAWLLAHQHDAGVKDGKVHLKDLKVGCECDIVCKVLHVCQVSKDESMLFVWDGTDTPVAALEANLDTEGENPFPLYLEASPLEMNTLRTFPPMGSIVRVTVKKCLNDVQHLLDGHHWVKLRMVTCRVDFGIWHIIFSNSSKLRLLSDENETVSFHERYYNERMTSELCRGPLFSFYFPLFITEVENRHAMDTTLMDSLTSSEVMHRCICVVRVVSAFPWRAEDIYYSVRGQYRLRLTLEDPTARVHAYVIGDDAVKFFGRFSSYNELTRKMNKLLGISKDADSTEGDGRCRNPPWMKCCLMSHYVEKSDPWQSRKYRIFGTKLVG